MLPFDPLFRNSHLQTVIAHFWVEETGASGAGGVIGSGRGA